MRDGDSGRDSGPAVVLSSVSKRYGRATRLALDDLSMEVEYGQVYGLLGPNGAGKTTSVGIMTTVVRASSGTVRVCGLDVTTSPSRVRGRIGVVPQENTLDRALSLRQNLLAHARYHGVGRRERESRATRLLAEFGLEGRSGERPHWLSGGQARRMMIARTLMHDPAVLFLDEPSNGLDPRVRRSVWDRVRSFASDGGAVVVTTHDMSEAEELCDRIAVIHEGRLLADGSPERLKTLARGSRETRAEFSPIAGRRLGDLVSGAAAVGLSARLVPRDAEADHVSLTVTGSAALDDPGSVLSQLARTCGFALVGLRVEQATLEDVFLQFTGSGSRP